MKKLLFISSRPIFPVVGGDQIRTFQCLEFLSKYFKIHIIALTTQEETKEALSKYTLYGDYTSFQIGKFRYYWQALHFLTNKKPIQVNYYHSTKVQKYINSIISDYDIVFCNNIRTAEYVKKHNIIKIIDFVDAISMNYEKARCKASFIKRLIYEIDYRRCVHYEQLILNEFNAAAIISDVDRKYILDRHKGEKEIAVIGNMVNWDSSIEDEIKEEDSVISFVGKMDYEPNVVAVTNFVNNIFPKIKVRKANTRFFIVGISPAQSVMKLHNGNDIVVTGFVPDVREYFFKSSIIVAPMLSGAGIQNKIIQAMSLGRCIVTTTIGAEGLNIENNEIAVVNGNEEISDTIVKLLENPQERERMGKAAKEYVENNLSYAVIHSHFYKLVEPFI